MKVSLARGELLESLSVVGKGLSSRTTLPILSGVLMTAGSDSLTLQSTDLEISIKTTAKVYTDEEGQTVLPGKLVAEIVRSLPEAAVTITTGEMNTATIECGRSSFSVKTLNPDDFPKFPEVKTQELVDIPGSLFETVVKQVSRAVSHDEARPVLTGVLVVVDGDLLRMVSTDSYRLCVREETIKDAAGALEAIVPGKAIEDVARLVSSADKVSVGVSENQVLFSFNDTTFISRRIEGTFPNFRQIIPKETTTHLLLDKDVFIEAVKRVSLLAQHNTPLRLVVDVERKNLTLSAQAQDIGDAKEDLEIEVEGEDVEIAFNHAYLLDGVSVVDDEKLSLDIVSPLKPGVIHAGEDDRFTYVIMPVRLS